MAKTPAQTSERSTEEDENKLSEEQDLDVIDCYTDPMDSDSENADERDRQASAACQEQVPEKSPTTLEDAGAIQGHDGLSQISDEVSSSSSESTAPSSNPEMSLSAKTDSEINRIVSEPLVKQMVVPEIDVSDGKDDELSQESLQIDDTGEDGEEALAANRSTSNETDGILQMCQEEIPDDLQLKLDFSMDVGGMDYATDDQAEPWSPEDIYTIDLLSTDEEAEQVSEAPETVPGESQNVKALRKSVDTDTVEPSSTKRQKKTYPHKKRCNKKGRSNSKCSAISASTVKSSIPDEGSMLENVENKNTENHHQETTDIALILETFISSATSDKNADLVLHSPSAEEIFSMDSLFASQEQPETPNIITGDEHIETLPLAESISSCITPNGTAQPEMANVQAKIVAPTTEKQQSMTNSTHGQTLKGLGRSKIENRGNKTESGANEKAVGILPKRGRPKGSKNKKNSDGKQDAHKKPVSKQSLPMKERKQTTKSALKRKFKELFGNSSSCSSLEQEPKLASSSIELQPKRASEVNVLENARATVEAKDSPRIVLSPFTADKLRGINAASQKPTSVAKACQTEISGLTWSVDFKKLRNLINRAEHTAIRGSNELPTVPSGSAGLSNGVDVPRRSVLQICLDSPSASTPQLVQPGPTGGSSVELGTNTTEQRSEQQANSARSSFRIPKRRASTSPQVVTSSTPHLLEKQDGPGANPRTLTSRSVDRSQQIGRASNSLRPSNSSGVVQRTIGNDNEDTENGNASSRDRQEVTLRMMVQERFQTPANRILNSGRENARNACCTPPSSAENGLPGIRQAAPSNQEPQPAPTSMSQDNRSGLPMVNVTRTINNDVSQPPQEPQSVLSGIRKLIAESNGNPLQLNVSPECGGVPATSYAASSSNAYNRGGIDPGHAGYGMMSMHNGDTMRMQQLQSRGSNPNNINDFLTMLREQFTQRQQPPIQPPVLPSVAPLQNMPIQAGSSQLPAFNQLFPQMGQIAAQPSALRFAEQPSNEQMICYIFGCIDFLNNRCFNIHCPYPHILPNREEVFQKVSTLNCDAITNTYRFVAGKDDLFIRYFPVYASVMGRNKMYQQLVNTIADCEKPKRPIRYYECIVEGLKTLGTSPVQAVQLILQKHTKKDFDQINVLVKLILDTVDGIPAFLRTLEAFLQVKGYRYEIISVNRLLGFCMQSTLPTNDLAAFVCKLILTVPAGEEQFVDVRTLLEFIQKVRLDAALTLDVEDIVKKYGSVAMRP